MVLLQTTVFYHLPFVPDLLLILCVYLGIYHGAMAGAASAFFLGYALDSCSGAPVGMWTFALSLVFTVTKLLSQSMWMYNPLSVLGLVACAVLLKAVTFSRAARNILGLGPHVVFCHTICGVGFTLRPPLDPTHLCPPRNRGARASWSING